MSFRLLDKTDLNIEKWNAMIQQAGNGRVNALSWYLDIVSHGKWKALVSEDYTYLMPLPINDRVPLLKRISIPPYSQQLGIFGQLPISEDLVSAALRQIPNYRQIIMQWSEFVPLSKVGSFEISMRPNYVLELNLPIETLRTSYSTNLKRNLKKIHKLEFKHRSVPAEAFENFYFKNTDKQTKVTPHFKIMFGKLIRAILKNDCGMIRGVYVSDRLIAACLFTNFNNRLIALLIRSNKEGKEHAAMHHIMDQIIAEYANSDHLLDFEGSAIDSVARFFKSFGAKLKPYPLLRRSRFPF